MICVCPGMTSCMIMNMSHIRVECAKKPAVTNLNSLFHACGLKIMTVKQTLDGVAQVTRYIVGACRLYEVVESVSQGKRAAIQQDSPCKKPRCSKQRGKTTKNSRRWIKHRLLTVCMS